MIEACSDLAVVWAAELVGLELRYVFGLLMIEVGNARHRSKVAAYVGF